ncbi:MAG: hypothetical protein V7K14_23380 [Nostoc sp.]|uniref:hypothetical protein n=1 Tax=Nostoc sp. TaxID=1180 RepID=UPI002FFB03DC
MLHFFQVFKRQGHKTSVGAIALFCLELLYRNTYRPLQERSPHEFPSHRQTCHSKDFLCFAV